MRPGCLPHQFRMEIPYAPSTREQDECKNVLRKRRFGILPSEKCKEQLSKYSSETGLDHILCATYPPVEVCNFISFFLLSA